MEIVYEIALIDGPKHAKFAYLKLHFLEIPMDSEQYNTEHYGMHDDTENEHSVYACVKGYLEPTHLKSSPLFTFSTKSLGQDSPYDSFISFPK